MTDSDAVLAANLEFYRAFAARDFDAMEALWAQRAPVACTHPGWPVLAERATIMESWDGIMSNPEAPRVTCMDERVYLYGDFALGGVMEVFTAHEAAGTSGAVNASSYGDLSGWLRTGAMRATGSTAEGVPSVELIETNPFCASSSTVISEP